MIRRRTKIVCTLGPATSAAGMIERIVRAGMDVARLNFSHGTHVDHARSVAAVRRAFGKHEKPIAILADLQGPKIRTGALENGRDVVLRVGQRFTITTNQMAGTRDGVSTTFRALPESVRKNDRILLSDGEIALRVLSASGRDVVCRVENGGELGEHKGINLPGIKLKIPSLTPKDRDDLAFALKQGADYIALSFVRTADGVMVARGDLGVEMKPEKVPVVQKQIISRARNALVPVITATQMLDSMRENPRPTRAEASDVANAVLDGSDALMLSGETAAGHYPLESVAMMDRIIREAEASVTTMLRPARFAELQISEAIAEAICHAAEDLRLKIVAVFTETGFSARLVLKYRPRAPIVAFSPNPETRRRLGLLWGVLPRRIARIRNIDELARIAVERLREEKLVAHGDCVGIIAGTPLGTRGTTNMMRFVRIGG